MRSLSFRRCLYLSHAKVVRSQIIVLFLAIMYGQIEVEEFGCVDLPWIVPVQYVDELLLRRNSTFSSIVLVVGILDRHFAL